MRTGIGGLINPSMGRVKCDSQFYKARVEFLDSVIQEKKLTIHAQAIFTHIERFLDGRKVAQIANSVLAQRTNSSIRTVQRAIDELVTKGLIVKLKVGNYEANAFAIAYEFKKLEPKTIILPPENLTSNKRVKNLKKETLLEDTTEKPTWDGMRIFISQKIKDEAIVSKSKTDALIRQANTDFDLCGLESIGFTQRLFFRVFYKKKLSYEAIQNSIKGFASDLEIGAIKTPKKNLKALLLGVLSRGGQWKPKKRPEDCKTSTEKKKIEADMRLLKKTLEKKKIKWAWVNCASSSNYVHQAQASIQKGMSKELWEDVLDDFEKNQLIESRAYEFFKNDLHLALEGKESAEILSLKKTLGIENGMFSEGWGNIPIRQYWGVST